MRSARRVLHVCAPPYINWYSAEPIASREALDAYGRYTGPVYESTGPYLERRKVGRVTIELIGGEIASVDLTIDGVELPRRLGHLAGLRVGTVS